MGSQIDTWGEMGRVSLDRMHYELLLMALLLKEVVDLMIRYKHGGCLPILLYTCTLCRPPDLNPSNENVFCKTLSISY